MGCFLSIHGPSMKRNERPEIQLPTTRSSGRRSARIKVEVEVEEFEVLDPYHPTSSKEKFQEVRGRHYGAAVVVEGVAEDRLEKRFKEKVLLVKKEQNPKIGRNISRNVEGEQIAAGWPAWLSAVAGEEINGWVPQSLSFYIILEKIGVGSYSIVYKARDTRHEDAEKIVALKKVRFDKMNAQSVQFMAREIKVLRRLNHPNVVKLLGLATSRKSTSLYLILEYMEHDLGGLTAYVETPFTEAQVKCYLQQLLRGLDHCHSRGVLHRDIKGPNLLLGNDGVLKIADFGLAKFYHPDQTQQLTSQVVTLWYRPPELLLGATQYGAAVDLWSTGCILAELLTGKPILPGRSEMDQLDRIFKLCGLPSNEFWKSSQPLNAKLAQPLYKRCIAERFKEFSDSSVALLETLLAIEPADRGSAATALQSRFFKTNPFACDLSSLPQYPPTKSNNIQAKFRHHEALLASRLAKISVAAAPLPEEDEELSVS